MRDPAFHVPADAAPQVAEDAGDDDAGILITSADGRIRAVNPAFTRLTGYTPAEAIGATPALLQSGRQGRAFYDALWQTLLRCGQWQGELWNRHRDGSMRAQRLQIRALRDAHGTVTHYLGVLTDIGARRARDAQVQAAVQLAADPLTGLACRQGFAAALARLVADAQADGGDVALLWLDIDRFGRINATLGLPVGDQALQQVAGRVQAVAAAAVDAQALIGRVGADEFAVALRLDAAAAHAQDAAVAFARAFEAPLLLHGRALRATLSIGHARFPADAPDAERLLQDAHAACEEAKASGGDAIRVLCPQRQAQRARRAELEQGLAHAAARGELFLEFQPKYDANTRALCGAEALARWRRGNGELVSPQEFIPVAESTGLIVEIGDWVTGATLAHVAEWRRQGRDCVPVAVNFSAPQLRRCDAVERIGRMLAEAGVPPRLLEIELTESQLVDDADGAVRTLQALHALGVRLAIDDFGTGYSSLAYLRRFPIDRLKIDRSFVRGMQSEDSAAEIVRAVIKIGHAFGLRVTAEGVETTEQFRRLSQWECDEVQGFLFSRPVAAREFMRLLPIARAVASEPRAAARREIHPAA